jgi:hypothetical protein
MFWIRHPITDIRNPMKNIGLSLFWIGDPIGDRGRSMFWKRHPIPDIDNPMKNIGLSLFWIGLTIGDSG